MKKKLFFITLLLVFALVSCGGEEDDYDDDIPSGGDGGNGQGDNDNEAEEWEINLEYSYFQKFVVDQNDMIYVSGFTYDNLYADLNGKNDPFFISLNKKGEKLWGKQWGVPVIHSSNNNVSGISVDSKGNIYITILANPSIFKFASDGTKVWEIFPELKNGDITTLALDKSDNIYIGIIRGEENDPNIIKYSADGKKLQSYNILGDSSCSINTLAIDSEGNLYAGGSTSKSLFSDNEGDTDAFLVKMAPDGTELWGKQWGSTKSDGVETILMGKENDIFVASYSKDDSIERLFNFSLDGNKIWGINQKCDSITMCNDNNIYCAKSDQIYKYNSLGEYLGTSATNYGLGYFKQLTCDSERNIYAITSNNRTVIKFSHSDFK